MTADELVAQINADVAALRALIPTQPPSAPTIVITANSISGQAPLSVTFTATVTNTTTVAWDFGDGQTGTGLTTTHTFAAGDFTVQGTASGAGGTASATVLVHVTSPPPTPTPSSEHDAVMMLVPADTATLFVPVGQTREITSDEIHVGGRVEGTLRLLSGTLSIDTLTTIGGTFEVPVGSTAIIVIRDTGPISDPIRIGRGIVWMDGSVRISGHLTIRSENTAGDRRGHVMCMTTDVIIDGLVEIIDCGRTDKSRPVTDPPVLDNVRGRYPLHFHKNGLTSPIVVKNVTVRNSPGWGIVNHLSNVQCDGCTCINTFGAGFVTETGREAGWFRNFTARDIPGLPGGTITDDTRNGQTHDDWGVAGHGVWIQGGGNVEVGPGTIERTRDIGFIHMNMKGIYVPLTELDNEYGTLRTIVWPGGTYDQGMIPSGDIPLRVRGVTIRNAGGGNLGYFPWDNMNPSSHDYRGDITDCRFEQSSLLSGYSNKTDYRRITMVGTPPQPTGGAFVHTGVVYGHTYEDCVVDGWGVGLQAPSDGSNTITRGVWRNVVDVLIINKPWPAKGAGRELTFDGMQFDEFATDAVLTPPNFNGSDIIGGRWNFYLAMWFVWADIRKWETLGKNDWWPNLFHWKDTFGPSDIIRVNGEYLCFEEWGRDFPLPSMIPDSYRLKADGTIKTAGEIYDEKGWALWGRVPVVGERRSRVRGLFTAGPAIVLDNPPVPS